MNESERSENTSQCKTDNNNYNDEDSVSYKLLLHVDKLQTETSCSFHTVCCSHNIEVNI